MHAPIRDGEAKDARHITHGGHGLERVAAQSVNKYGRVTFADIDFSEAPRDSIDQRQRGFFEVQVAGGIYG